MPEAVAPAIQRPQSQSRLLQRLMVWTVVTLAVLCLLCVGGIFGARWYVSSRPKEYAHCGGGASFGQPAQVDYLMDRLPDGMVYKCLIEQTESEDWDQVYGSLVLIEIRAYGGWVRFENALAFPQGLTPSDGAKTWVHHLPKQFLEDFYVVNNPTPPAKGWGYTLGTNLIKIVEPTDPRWQRTASTEEFDEAAKRLKAVLAGRKAKH